MKTQRGADHIYQLIRQGEHQQQDFKFEISDARKIAKSLSAFSNTEGGRLLVGVKDNGKIAGVRSEEEIYMVEAAAKLYSKPQISCKMHVYEVEGLQVLEVVIPKGKCVPYYAKDENNHYRAYIRIKDENILATPVHIRLWQSQYAPKGVFVRYSAQEQHLLNFLSQNEKISLTQCSKLIGMPRPKAINTLAKFIHLGLIEPIYREKNFFYRLCPQSPIS